MFHVPQLKKKLSLHYSSQTQLPLITENGIIQASPEAILDRRLVKRRGRVAVDVLVHW